MLINTTFSSLPDCYNRDNSGNINEDFENNNFFVYRLVTRLGYSSKQKYHGN